ncbi:MAG: NACHT domain-containing protein, partial [Gammaproteobacteria bacterium]
KSEGYSLQEESFRVFAEQRYLREHTQLQEVFAQYGREYQYILFDEPDDGEEKKRDVSSPQVFFSYAWPILDRFPHEWWHQLFLVGLRRDLRDLFRIEAYVDVIDSIDNPVRYMIENFSQEFFESQDEARHRSSLNAQGSSKLICMMGSQSFVEKCMNEEFIGSMVRDEKTYIQDYISTYTRSRAPLAQIPVMAFSLGHYRRSILPNFQGHINAYEAHKHSYGQYIQAILYKLFLCMPHTEEQKSRCEDLLLRMRNDPRLEELHKRTDDSIKEYYLDEHLLENVEQLRNDYNLPHWPDGELERVVGIWRDSISEERAQSSVVCQRSLFSNAFLDLIDASAMIDEDFLAIGDTLKARYLEESTIALFEDERPIPLEKLFVNLVIVQENEQRKKDLSMKEVGREDFQVLTQHYDDIHTPKEEIDVKNIFKGSNNLSEQKTPRKIELLGRAGIGKTTFLLYLLRQWALGEPWLEGYQAMFYFPLKKVVHKYDKGGAYSMAEVLRKEFFLGVPDFTLEKANAYWRY